MSKINITQFAKQIGKSRQHVYDLDRKGVIRIKRDGRGPYLETRDIEKVKEEGK